MLTWKPPLLWMSRPLVPLYLIVTHARTYSPKPRPPHHVINVYTFEQGKDDQIMIAKIPSEN